MKLDVAARNIDRHAPSIAILGSIILHVSSILAMHLRDQPQPPPPPPPVAKVRIFANPNGNPNKKDVKVVEIAKPKPKPKPNKRVIATKKEEPKQEEPQPENNAPQSFGDDTTGGIVGTGTSTATGDDGLTANWQPLEKETPEMPQIAMQRGIEGFLKFRMDINEEGVPENIEVVQAENRNVFERSAWKALRKWRYAPRMVNGQPVRVIGHIVTIDFKLTE